MSKVMTREFELVSIHSDQLVHTVQEEDEEGSIIFAVVHIHPMLHLPLRWFYVLYIHMLLQLVSVTTMQDQCLFPIKIMLKVEPFFINKDFESLKSSVVWIK